MCWCKLHKADIVFSVVTVLLFLTGLLVLVVPEVIKGNASGYDYFYIGYIFELIGVPFFWSATIVVGAIVWTSVRFCPDSECSVQRQIEKERALYLAAKNKTEDEARRPEVTPTAEVTTIEVEVSQSTREESRVKLNQTEPSPRKSNSSSSHS
jgi:hypothetical protein